jgi:hypothetical protein
MPKGSDAIEYVAIPEAFRVAEPSTAAPLWKLTVPTGVPLEPVTVAVKVTLIPGEEGFRLELRATLVVA